MHKDKFERYCTIITLQREIESATDAYLFFNDCNATDSIIEESITLGQIQGKA